jgi:hypothetical protein
MKRFLRRFLAILLLYLFVEGLCYLGLEGLDRFFDLPYDPNVTSLSERQRNRLRTFVERARQGATSRETGQDPVVGWVNVQEVNAAGMRDDREHEVVPPAGILRVAAFGDSFVFGSDVALPETWSRQITALDPSVEVLNYGVGAYGLDQAFLRYRQVGREYHPHVVLLGFMSENIARNVNVFRAFYTQWYRHVIFTKPRFAVRDGELVLLPNPLSTIEDHERLLASEAETLARLGENDYHYQRNYDRGPFDLLPSVRFAKLFLGELHKMRADPIFGPDGLYRTDSEPFAVTVRIFDAFYRAVLEDGSQPIILVFADVHDQQRSRDGKVRRYEPLLDDFRAKGYRFLDALDALKPYESSHAIEDLVVEWGHYSPLGSRILAQHIVAYLSEQGLADPAAVERAVRSERERLGLEPAPGAGEAGLR